MAKAGAMSRLMDKFAGIKMFGLGEKRDEMKMSYPESPEGPQYPRLYINKPLPVDGLEKGDQLKAIVKLRVERISTTQVNGGEVTYDHCFEVISLGIIE